MQVDNNRRMTFSLFSCLFVASRSDGRNKTTQVNFSRRPQGRFAIRRTSLSKNNSLLTNEQLTSGMTSGLDSRTWVIAANVRLKLG